MNVFYLALAWGMAGLLLVAAGIPVVARQARRGGFLDRPDAQAGGRKGHDRPTPPIGGLVIIPAFCLLAWLSGLEAAAHWPLYTGLILLAATGAVDDRWDLSPGTKLFIQLVVATLLAVSGEATLRDLGHLFGANNTLELGWISIPFTVASIVFLINAMNMIDGVDGLAGGVSVAMLGWLAAAAVWGGEGRWLTIALILIGLVVGFLVHNMRYPGQKRARVFLGDAGSMGLGLLLAWLAINIAEAPTPGLLPIGVALVILVPIVDTFALFIVRVRGGRGAFSPGRDHFHHLLLDRGMEPQHVSALIAGIACLGGALGVAGPHLGVGEGALTLIWVAILLGYTAYRCRHGKTPVGHGENRPLVDNGD